MYEGSRKPREEVRETALPIAQRQVQTRRQEIRSSAFNAVTECSRLAGDEPAYARYIMDRIVRQIHASGVANVLTYLASQARNGRAEWAILAAFARFFLSPVAVHDGPLKIARVIVSRDWSAHDTVEVIEWSHDLELFGSGMLPEGKRRGF